MSRELAKLQIFLAVVFVSLFANPTNSSENFNKLSDSDNKTFAKEPFASSSSNCGGIIRQSYTRLAYKPFENVLANERCVWIIAGFSGNQNISNSYEITATYLGSDQHLSYATVTSRSPLISHYYPKGEGPINSVTATGHVLIVTFSTGNSSSNGKGFILQIHGTEYSTAVNASSRYEILNTDANFHSHPPDGGEYLNNELSVLAFPPTSYDLDRFRTQVVLVKEIQLEQTNDRIEVYLFSASTNSWTYSGRLESIGSSNTEKIIHDDVILLALPSVPIKVWCTRGLRLLL